MYKYNLLPFAAREIRDCMKTAVFLYVQSFCTSWLPRPGARDPRRIWQHWREAKLLLRGFELH